MPLRFFRDEPLFGLDIGRASIKAAQLDVGAESVKVSGYGTSEFDPAAIENGVIVKPETIAAAMRELFTRRLVGAITSRRVACSLPTGNTFSRPMKLPAMEPADIMEAVHLEAEQYIPMPLENLYLDYEISKQDKDGIELLLMAIPRKIVDSYSGVLEALKLDPVAFEPGINAAARLVQRQSGAGEPVIIVDIGSITADVAVFDKTLLVATTVNGGSDTYTDLIARSFHTSLNQASEIKKRYGISYSQRQQRIIDALAPQLQALVSEIEKSTRYYSERAAHSGKKVSRIITTGGGAIMPGLNSYLAQELRLPADNLDPWQKFDFGQLAAPPEHGLVYATAAGEAILNPTEVLE